VRDISWESGLEPSLAYLHRVMGQDDRLRFTEDLQQLNLCLLLLQSTESLLIVGLLYTRVGECGRRAIIIDLNSLKMDKEIWRATS